uniref:Uncharacterized protein n=1 Tax=Steinernema glaseri TaxID=37863 RepID=A0A1I8A0U2_9BILA
MALPRVIAEKAREVTDVEAEIDALKEECETLERSWVRPSNRDLGFLKAFGSLVEKTRLLKKTLEEGDGPEDDEKEATAQAKEVEDCRRLQKQRQAKEAEEERRGFRDGDL